MGILDEELSGNLKDLTFLEATPEEMTAYNAVISLDDEHEGFTMLDRMRLEQMFIEFESVCRLEKEAFLFERKIETASMEAKTILYDRIDAALMYHGIDMRGKEKRGLVKSVRAAAAKVFKRIMDFFINTFRRMKKAVTSRLPGARKIEELSNEINQYNDAGEFKFSNTFQIFLLDGGREIVDEKQIIKAIQDVQQVVSFINDVENDDVKETFNNLSSGKLINNFFPSVVQTDNRTALKVFNMGMHKDSDWHYTATFDTVNMSGNTTRQINNRKRTFGKEAVFARETVKELARSSADSLEILQKLDLYNMGKKIAAAQKKRFDAVPEGDLSENTPIIRAVTSFLMSLVNYQMTLADHGSKLAAVNLQAARKKQES